MNVERSSDEIHFEIGIQGVASYMHNNPINVLIEEEFPSIEEEYPLIEEEFSLLEEEYEGSDNIG